MPAVAISEPMKDDHADSDKATQGHDLRAALVQFLAQAMHQHLDRFQVHATVFAHHTIEDVLLA